jgi:predicted metal-dependent enzyme (double-stranded beta helix superfamily)
VARFAEQLGTIIETCTETERSPAAAEYLKELLATPDLLAPEHRAGCDTDYCRHVLYADPQGRFTLLALVWQPGQQSSVHGHTAWCAMGVLEGRPQIECFDVTLDAEGNAHGTPRNSFDCAPGDVCALQAGLDDVHRVGNQSDDTVISLHVYGCDLVADPQRINQTVLV